METKKPQRPKKKDDRAIKARVIKIVHPSHQHPKKKIKTDLKCFDDVINFYLID